VKNLSGTAWEPLGNRKKSFPELGTFLVCFSIRHRIDLANARACWPAGVGPQALAREVLRKNGSSSQTERTEAKSALQAAIAAAKEAPGEPA
jgi:hypothetical protein